MEKGQFFQWSWYYKENRLRKHIRKENFRKGLINSIETNYQINMTSDNFVSSNNSFKSHLNAKGFNMLLTWLKHASHQKAESFKAASPSNLDNIIINNSSNFNTKCWILYKMVGAPSFSQPILWIQATLQSLPWNSSFSSVNFHFPISPLQSTLTLCSYITQLLFISLLLRTTIPTIYTKNIFRTSNIFPIQATSRDQEVREYCENWHCFDLSLLPQSTDNDSRAHSQSLILYSLDSKNWYIAGVANHLVPLLSYPQPIFVTSIFN